MVTNEDIVSITENVFSTMVGSGVEVASESVSLAEADPFTGCVHISGEWTGAVLVQTSGDLARHAASSLLAMDEEALQLADCQDAIAELANMIGGNIKSLVPGPSALSLPTVTSGKEFDIRIFGTQIENEIAMQCNGQQLRVVVCRADG
ncbi:MAG: chemotaxis protein CheX [Pirellulaceae bacterium]